MMDEYLIQEFAPAKINLYLHIHGRRADGYHDLDSLVVFASIGDNLTLKRAASYSLEVTGPFATTLVADNLASNLVLKAADVVAHCIKEIPPGGLFSLEKNLPIASGIGGGSSDAAACVRALLKLYDHKLSDIARQQIALAIGSDVSVCLEAKASRMSGAGHAIQPIKNFPKLNAVLVNPGVQISTADIFKTLSLKKGEKTEREICTLPNRFDSLQDIYQLLKKTSNDLEVSARAQAPIIGSVISEIERQEECMIARMSGSGATCFGLFSSESLAQKATHDLSLAHPDWWIQNCVLS